MPDYDFSTINDKVFERLSAALLSRALGHRVERFKPGKDGGVDGRFFASPNEETVVQCKHWLKSGLPKLVRHLRVKELPKIKRLAPSRYVLVTSVPLSRKNKRSLQKILSPHVLAESDIYGPSDLNDLLQEHPDIERDFFQLWLTSTVALTAVINNAIWGRSEWHLADIRAKAMRYAPTSKHKEALEILADKQVLIVTGEPGVGKTTLAEQICLQLAAKSDYQLISVADDIADAEQVFDRTRKQVILFDDFLGRNYLDALRRNEDTRIVQFISRVRRDKLKRLVLTSRTTILSQGKRLSDQFRIGNVEQSEFEVRVAELTPLEKAQILYSHLWFGDLASGYVDELYVNRRYRDVIHHPNFNPRLIEFITDSQKLESVSVCEYWKRVESTLSNPLDVWQQPFDALLTEGMRLLVLLVTLNRHPISESDLRAAYDRLSELLPRSSPPLGKLGFIDATRLLTGSFLTRELDPRDSSATFDLFGPSIGDYVLARFIPGVELLELCFLALGTVESLASLTSLSSASRTWRRGSLTEEPPLLTSRVHARLLTALSAKLAPVRPSESDAYRLTLAEALFKNEDARQISEGALRDFLATALNDELALPTESLAEILLAGLTNGMLTDQRKAICDLLLLYEMSFDTLDDVSLFFQLYEALGAQAQDPLREPATEAVLECWENVVADWLSEQGSLDEFLDDAEQYEASQALDAAIEGALADYPLELPGGVSRIASCVDLDSVFEANRNARLATNREERDDEEHWERPAETSPIDDLFDRT